MELWSKMGKCSFVVTKESLQENRIGQKVWPNREIFAFRVHKFSRMTSFEIFCKHKLSRVASSQDIETKNRK